MRLNLDPEDGEWCTFAEPVGVGDGETRKFKLPFGPKEATGLLITRNMAFVAPDEVREKTTEEVTTQAVPGAEPTDDDATTIRRVKEEEPDGYVLETNGVGADSTELYVVFSRAPGRMVNISASRVGYKEGTAFFVRAPSKSRAKAIDAAMPTKMKTVKGAKTATFEEQSVGFERTFKILVGDWYGMETPQLAADGKQLRGEDGKVLYQELPFSDEALGALLEAYPAQYMALWAVDRSHAIRKMRLLARAEDDQD